MKLLTLERNDMSGAERRFARFVTFGLPCIIVYGVTLAIMPQWYTVVASVPFIIFAGICAVLLSNCDRTFKEANVLKKIGLLETAEFIEK